MAERKSFGAHKWKGELEFDGEVFEVHSIPGWLYMEWIRQNKLKADDDEMAELLYDVFRMSMPEPEFERFQKFAKSPAGPDIHVLVEAMEWIAGRGADRPTKASSRSRPGRRQGAAGEPSSEAGSTSKPSTSPTSAT